jgi:hypothetical protein
LDDSGAFSLPFEFSFPFICIPSSLETISRLCFTGTKQLWNVAFEAGSRLSSLGESAFSSCPSLQSIYLPSSVETVGKSCFRDCKTLSNVWFEGGCRLSVFPDSLFEGCSSLDWVSIPAGVCQIHGSSLGGSGVSRLLIDAPNRFFRLCGDFLVNFDETSLIRYLGHDTDVIISGDIDCIS